MADGVLSVKDIDTVMTEGLGMRYVFLGAFETAHLNAEGKLIVIRMRKESLSLRYNNQASFSMKTQFTLQHIFL